MVVICAFAIPTANSKPHRVTQSSPPTVAAPNARPSAPLPVAIVSQPPVPEEERRAIEAERTQKAASDAALVTWTKILGIATLVLACGTIALWWATRRLVEGADKTAERQLRSYLFAEVFLEYSVVGTPIGNVSSPIRVRIIGHGATPAVLVKVRASATIAGEAPKELPTVPGSDEEMPSGIAIAPNGTYEISVLLAPDHPDLAEVNAGTKSLFCCGIVVYEDVLGIRRETGYCWHLVKGQAGAGDWFTITPGTPLNYRT